MPCTEYTTLKCQQEIRQIRRNTQWQSRNQKRHTHKHWLFPLRSVVVLLLLLFVSCYSSCFRLILLSSVSFSVLSAPKHTKRAQIGRQRAKIIGQEMEKRNENAKQTTKNESNSFGVSSENEKMIGRESVVWMEIDKQIHCVIASDYRIGASQSASAQSMYTLYTPLCTQLCATLNFHIFPCGE